MTIRMRDSITDALLQHAKGQIIKHKMNVEVYLNNPAGIGEHPDVMAAIEEELAIIAKYHEQIEVISRYFTP
jgi:hypothetical protein|tara:strand:+ start:2236 stop:2451 length:216 start_codon:yes stop_codon:yes gene_type:complete